MASGLTGASAKRRSGENPSGVGYFAVAPTSIGSPCRNADLIDCMVHFLTSLEDRAARPGNLSALRDHQQRLL